VVSKELIEQRIERLRHKLLDLTTMNRMLSFKHPKASCLRIVDELPHHLFDVLRDSATLTFEPVPEPTQRELEAYNVHADQVRRANETRTLIRPDAPTWARHLGFNVNYDLPVETDAFERAERHADRKIQTLHYPDELDARLRKIRAAARTAIEESGANMLYLAFGFLEWRDQQTSKAHQAPLVLLPVELEREPTRAGQFRTRVRWTGEELQPNLSLKKKLEELNIQLPDLEEDQSLEGFLVEVTRAVRHKPDWVVRRYVTLGLFEFGKILLYLDLDPDRWPSHAPLSSNGLVKEILGGWDEGGVGESSSVWGEEPDESDAAAKRRDLKLEIVDRADSSQCEALDVALSGRNLVVQGPPGTGKSQTITNLVAAALARGKTVLFVAEKLAALEVVRRRMRELGLGDFCLELHSHKTRKTEVLEDILTRIKASNRIRAPKDYEGALSRLTMRHDRLGAYIDIVGQPAAGFAGLTISDALMKAGQARRKLGPKVKDVEALREYFSLPDDLSWATFADAKGRLKNFGNAIVDLGIEGSAFAHVWAGVSSTKVLPHDRDQIAALALHWAEAVDKLSAVLSDPRLAQLQLTEIAVAEEQLSELAQRRADLFRADGIAAEIEEALGVDLERSGATVGNLLRLIECAGSAPMGDLNLRNSALLSPGASQLLRKHQDELARLKAEADELGATFRDAASEAHVDDLEEWSAALVQKGLFVRLGKRWKAATRGASGILRPAKLNAPPAEKAAWLERLRKNQLELKALKANKQAEAIVGDGFEELGRSLEPFLAVGGWADTLRAQLPPHLVQPLQSASSEVLERIGGLRGAVDILQRVAALVEHATAERSYWRLGATVACKPAVAKIAGDAEAEDDWRALASVVAACSRAAQHTLAAERAFVDGTNLDEEYWFGSDGRPDFASVARQAHSAAENAELLPAWLDFDRAYKSSDVQFEAPVAVAGADAAIEPELMPLALDFLVFDAIARTAFASNPGLLSASGKSLDVLRSEYAALDAEVMELRRAHIGAQLLTKKPPEGRNSGRKSDLTEMALIRAELAKQKRHIPIRQLVGRAGKAIQTLKPCFMMGPLSVAQYIAPGTLKFDLVIMDEASQMRPEDAIGALARGGQAVIVGDTKQLPPTSFFDRIADGSADEDDDEATLAEDAKSILELSEAIFTPRMLRWHYRSRHESLIAFSNKHFYKNDLIVFPSPSGQDGRFGIGWNYLGDGAATGGVNPVEARAVAKAAAHALLHNRRRTVGVVAMNVKQAQRISDELAALAKADAVLAKVLSDAENNTRGEPFFVKNLENVQGDERDVIIISMTYGPSTPGGRVPQNFGPITLETGWRRLNVLFTRAKERMEVFSSMRSSDVIPKEGSDRGTRALKLFLEYAETGRLGEEAKPSDRDPDNDFEDAVIEGLRELNFECVPQVGVANFFLDIGVRDPNAAHEFIAAVECDGASYHSSKSARDRDRLRQEILENLGWSIIRIWSTDWFRDPAAELSRVAEELKRLIAARVERRAESIQKQPAPRPATSPPELKLATPAVQGRLELATPAAPQQGVQRSANELSRDDARAELIDLRETTIKTAFPDADPARGLLRKSMLDELLRKRPKDHNEFLVKMPMELRQNTDAEQLKKFGEDVFAILERIS
jgi:very-short-patch-repair endonuclease